MAIIDIKVPSVGESITEVSLNKWMKPDGALIKLDEIICEFESDKATFEVPAEKEGILTHKAKEGDDLQVGDIFAQINTSDIANKVDTSSKPNSQIESKENKSTKRKKIITEAEVDTTKNVSKIIEPADIKEISTETVFIPDPRGERKEKLSRMRRTISKRLVAVKNQTAMLTTFNEVDMTAIMDMRNKYNESYQAKYGIKIGFMSIFAKACAIVLKEMPELNAFIDDDHIIYHDFVDISIAISTPNGLVVPPIKNVDSIKIYEFEKQLKDLAEKARTGKLSMDEMTGGTFTITNGGVFGSLMSTPILNEPQSAILGMHAIKDRPVAINGKVEIRPMMYLALSYDHRIIDGSSSVTFLVKVKEILENPLQLVLEI